MISDKKVICDKKLLWDGLKITKKGIVCQEEKNHNTRRKVLAYQYRQRLPNEILHRGRILSVKDFRKEVAESWVAGSTY